MNMTKRKGCLIKAAIFFLLLPFIYMIGNPLSGHTLQARLDNLKWFTSIRQTGKSPDGRYNFHVMHYGMAGSTYVVRLAKPWDISARNILRADREDIIPYGPFCEVAYEYGIAWAQDGERCALICRGWYTDCYDIQSDTGNRFPYGLYPSTDMDKLKAYHAEVAKFIGENPIIVIE